MALFSFWGKAASDAPNELPEIYPLPLALNLFTQTDVTATYAKILTDTLERTHGLKEEQETLLWDNCVQSETNEGLVTLLSKAMVSKSELFLVYLPSVNVLRIATDDEKKKIKEDYATAAKSDTGVYISFKNFKKTDLLLVYSALEYCILASLHKSVNIAKAVQIQVDGLRSSVALSDAEVAFAQARSIAAGLRAGKDIVLDAKDRITNATPDVSPTEKAIAFLDAKRAFLLGFPLAYISGLQTGGLGATGESDMRAVERGLKLVFKSIIQPVLSALFDAKTEFKSQDFRQMSMALEVLKTFELVSDDYLSRESKQDILARVFDLDPDEEKKNLEAEADEREESGDSFDNREPGDNDNQPSDTKQAPTVRRIGGATANDTPNGRTKSNRSNERETTT